MGMDWAEPAFTQAARLRVFRSILTAADKATLEYLADFARKEVMRKARGPVRSTSASSNRLGSEVCSAWVEVLELIEGYAGEPA